MIQLYGLILAGGKSTRMGQDKALLSYHGKPQIEFTYELMSPFCSKVFLSKRVDQPSYPNIPSLDDLKEFEGTGPLGGICSALKMHPQHSWLVMACDLPFVTPLTLRKLIAERDPKKMATAFISTHDGHPEPLCAIWEGSGFEAILKLFDSGIHCPRKVLIKSDVHLIAQDNPQWLDNVNNIEEYLQANKKILKNNC